MPNVALVKTKSISESGFTMVEILVVIAILSIISAISFNVINYKSHQENAKDALRRNNVSKLVNVMETYVLAEKRYPFDTNGDGQPSFAENPMLSDYLKNSWPNNEPVGATYTYAVDASGASFGIVVANSKGDKTIKYRSTWGRIQECALGSSASTDGC